MKKPCGVGVKWAKTVTNTYSLSRCAMLREALTTKEKGPRSSSRKANANSIASAASSRQIKKRIEGGERVVRERFGIDPDTCTGDHSCTPVRLPFAHHQALQSGPAAP